jgi:hypothetical protein
MKKAIIILAMAMLLAASISSAEGPVDKGSMIVGGEVSFTSQGGDLYENSDEDGVTTIAFMPNLSFFVAPSIAVGGEVIFQKFSQGDYSESAFGIGPTVAYFFNTDPTRTEIKGAVYPYVQVYFQYIKLSRDAGDGDDEATMTAFGGKGGIMYMLTKHWAVNSNLYFQSESFKPDGADDSVSGSTMGLSVGVTAFLF